MAAAEAAEQFHPEALCSLCSLPSKQPAPLACGHKLCRACLNRCWGEEEEEEDGFACARCRETTQEGTFRPRRGLKHLVEKYLELEARGVCTRHPEEPLTFLCGQDEAPICVTCKESCDHQSHPVLPLEEASQLYKEQIQSELRKPEMQLEDPVTLKENLDKISFDGTPEKLSYFTVHVSAFMRKYRGAFESDASRVRYVGARLEGQAANWLVSLFDMDAPELGNLDEFMQALQVRFKDPFEEEKAQAQLQNLVQGSWSVGRYASEFRYLASKAGWPEFMKEMVFIKGLNREIFEQIPAQVDPKTFMEWVQVACDVEKQIQRVKVIMQLQNHQREKTQQRGKNRRYNY